MQLGRYLAFAMRYPDGTLDRMISDHVLTILRPDLEAKPHADLKKTCKAYQHGLGAHYYLERVVHALAQRQRAAPGADQHVAAAPPKGARNEYDAAPTMPAAAPAPAPAPPEPAALLVAGADPDAVRRAAQRGQARRNAAKRARSGRLSWSASALCWTSAWGVMSLFAGLLGGWASSVIVAANATTSTTAV